MQIRTQANQGRSQGGRGKPVLCVCSPPLKLGLLLAAYLLCKIPLPVLLQMITPLLPAIRMLNHTKLELVTTAASSGASSGRTA
jgi:hypothetical protein